MSASRRRGSLIFPLVVIGVGVVLLLINLGVVSPGVWGELVRFWPILLIALGVDILVGRPSFGAALSTLITVCVLVGLGLAAFYLFGPDTWVSKRQSFAHPLGSATAAHVSLSCEACAISIEGAANPDHLIEGTVTTRRGESLEQTTRPSGEALAFELASNSWLPFSLTASRDQPWNLRLHPTIPIVLDVETDGTIDLDLRSVRAESIDVSAGRRACVIVLPRSGRTILRLSGDDVAIRVPDGGGVRILGNPSGLLATTGDYVAIDGGLQSPDYDTAEAKADLHVRPGLVDLDIAPLEETPLSEPEAT